MTAKKQTKSSKVSKVVSDAGKDLKKSKSKLVKELSAKILSDRANGVKKVRH